MTSRCCYCAAVMVPRNGKYGLFLACPNSTKDKPHPTRSISSQISTKTVNEPEKKEKPEGWYSEEDESRYEYREWNGDYLLEQYHDDGRTTVHWGGPCAPSTYDKFGEEC